jgi:KDO2-lipid IV(A) lauroyltransferase
VGKPITSRIPDASIDEQANDMTEQVNQCFEQWISETPGQWLCMKRRWPKAHRL